MTLKDISIKNLLRRKGKALFVLAGLLIGVSTVVGIISFVEGSERCWEWLWSWPSPGEASCRCGGCSR